MVTRAYVNNRYKGFIAYLSKEIKCYEYECEEIDREREEILERYEKIDDKVESLREYVLFLYINHQWNMIMPIEQVAYPGVVDEYSSYAWELTYGFLEEGVENIKEEEVYDYIEECYSGMCCKIEGCKEEMQELTKNIINITYTLLEQEKNKENKYWRDMFFAFYNRVLGRVLEERLKSIYWMRKEVEDLEKYQQERLDEKGNDYPLFLYINHLLNTQHLIKAYYPGIPYYYEKYAWQIVETLNKGEETLYDIVIDTVQCMEQIGYRYNAEYLEAAVYELLHIFKKIKGYGLD